MNAHWHKETKCYVADLEDDGSEPIFSIDGETWTDSMGAALNDAEFQKKRITFIGGPVDDINTTCPATPGATLEEIPQ